LLAVLVSPLKDHPMNKDLIANLNPEELDKMRGSLKDLFEALWGSSGVVIAIVDRNFPGLDIPEHLRAGECPLVLRYDANPVIPIPDLELTPLGLSATLSFDRTPRKTFVPWEAIDEIASIHEQAPEEKTNKKPRLSLVP